MEGTKKQTNTTIYCQCYYGTYMKPLQVSDHNRSILRSDSYKTCGGRAY